MTTYKSVKYNISGADLTGIPTSAITSGTFADARISESSVTAHVTATDLQPIKSDISALALREATNEASAAFNLPNQFIDTFTNDTNLGTQTDGDRLADGCWATAYNIITDEVTLVDGSGATCAEVTAGTDGTYLYGSNAWSVVDDATHTAYQSHYNQSAYRSPKTWDCMVAGGTGAVGHPGTATGYGILGNYHSDTYSANDVKYAVDIGVANVEKFKIKRFQVIRKYSNGTWDWILKGSNDLSGAWTTIHTKNTPDGTSATADQDTGYFTNDNFYRYYQFGCYNFADTHDCHVRKLRFYGTTYAPTASATGTLIQSTNTVATSKTKVGGTMLYKDNEGTNTLGTDLKIYFTCDGGSNWTEAASYNAVTPVYSTGIKQVRLGETTCTSGTDVRYKAVYANQATGSKEFQLHGIGINY